MNLEEQIIAINQQENRRFGIHQMFNKMAQYDVTVKRIDGRRIYVSDEHSVIDFASCNYLGLDLDPEMGLDVNQQIQKWGVHPSWCRLVASPQIYEDAENKIAQLIGTEACVILPTVTLISIGVIPALVGKTGVLILDKSGHETMYEAAKIARDSGAKLLSFKQNDLSALEEHLKAHENNLRKVILIDGVYSMSGDLARLPEIVELAKKYNAIVYIDDAHGFGVIGENPTHEMPYGFRGNGIVKYYNLDYDNIIYVGGCSKAYSSLAAFVGCSKKMQEFIKAFSTPYDLSGPCPTASLATLLSGMQINEKRGDEYRQKLYQLTHKTILGLRKLGFDIINESGFPIVFTKIGNNEDTIETANLLFEKGILVTVSPYPMVIHGEEGHRITLTAANTEEDVETLISAFGMVKDYILNKHNRTHLYA